MEEGFLVAADVCPGEIPGGEISEPFGLIVTSQFTAPGVKGRTYESGVLSEGCENQAVAGGRIPKGFVRIYRF